eukprot:m.208499 g.208499  ORF g.208499 m.208499 type:complete len:156 (+) comp16926_c1_seq3:17-484(+)
MALKLWQPRCLYCVLCSHPIPWKGFRHLSYLPPLLLLFFLVLRNSPKGDKPLGMGTVRMDRPAPKLKSVADTTNYGDPTTATSLITPSSATRLGLSATELEEKRPMNEIRRVFAAMSVELSDTEFEEAWALATAESLNNKASILDFQGALANLHS